MFCLPNHIKMEAAASTPYEKANLYFAATN